MTTPAQGESSRLLSVRGLNVYYGESHILRNVDLSIAPGQMACLIGLNGVGKTTLLKSIIGLVPQRSGCIELAGSDCGGLAPTAAPGLALAMCPKGGRSFPSSACAKTCCWVWKPCRGYGSPSPY